MSPAPRPFVVPDVPWGWHYAGRARPGPWRVDVGRRRIALFTAADGRLSAMDARCVHMGADLSRGCVTADGLQCPMHAWAFAPADGRCARLPASPDAIPPFARQAVYPTAVVAGHAFVFNRPGPTPPFPMPFFDGRSPADLRPARPTAFDAPVPWHMVTANGFDAQHFRAAHDRTLAAEPTIDCPVPFARRARAAFDVTGHAWRDRVTRLVSGPRVTLSITVYAGTLALVTSAFRRTTTYGLVAVTPTGPDRCRVVTIIWVPRRRLAIARALVDPVDAAVRRSFVDAFLQDDKDRGAGLRYDPATLVPADDALRDYFAWLADTVQGEPFSA